MRKIIEIFFYVISGIFLYSAILSSFIEAEYFIVTLIFLCVLCLLAIITFCIGQKISIFAVITLSCLLNSVDLYRFTSRSTPNIFNNYIQGLFVTIFFLIVGWFLIRLSNIKAEQPCAGDSEKHAAPNTERWKEK